MLHRRGLSLGLGLIAALASAAPAFAQKQGGTLRSYIWDNPPSASIHEEATISTVFPFMPVFNNLVALRPDQARGLPRHHRSRPGDELELGRTQDAAHL